VTAVFTAYTHVASCVSLLLSAAASTNVLQCESIKKVEVLPTSKKGNFSRYKKSGSRLRGILVCDNHCSLLPRSFQFYQMCVHVYECVGIDIITISTALITIVSSMV
jgi:hypothetical protein